MRLAKKLSALLKRKGYRLTAVERDAVNDFVATVYDNNPTMSDGPANEEQEGASVENLSQVRSITCPHCGETIDIELDLSGGDQDDIQDCEVCCSPIRVVYTVHNGTVETFSIEDAS